MTEIDSKFEEFDFLYEQTRKQIEHEDTLLNHRSTWLLTLQGFLYTAYALSLTSQATATKNPDCNDLISLIDSFRDILPYAGILSSFSILFGIIAAAASICELAINWNDRKAKHRKYPQIIGNYQNLGTIAGLIPTLCLPFIFSITWLILRPSFYTQILFALLSIFSVYLIFKSDIFKNQISR